MDSPNMETTFDPFVTMYRKEMFPTGYRAGSGLHETATESWESHIDVCREEGTRSLSSLEILTWSAWAVLAWRYSGSPLTSFDVIPTASARKVALNITVVPATTIPQLLVAVQQAFSTATKEGPSSHNQDVTSQVCVDSTGDHGSHSAYTWVLSCVSKQACLKLTACYDKHTLDVRQTRRILAQLSHVLYLLSSVGDEVCLQDLDIVCPQDKDEIFGWNRILPSPIELCIHDMYEDQAQRRPSALAVQSWDGKLTYKVLSSLSDRLANHLQSIGVQAGTLMPLLFDKGLWAKVAMLAVLKIGGVCVSLDPTHPRARILGIVQEINAAVLIGSPACISEFHDVSHLVPLDAAFMQDLHYESPSPRATVRPTDAAFVIFSSGSTGKPKGIVLPHFAICTSVIEHGRALHISEKSRVLQFAAYTFDVSIYEIFITLLQGGCIFVPSNKERLVELRAYMQTHQITWATLTPSLASSISPDDVPYLRGLNLVGECPSQDNVRAWSHKVALFNGYGSAETSTAIPGQLLPNYPANWIGRPAGANAWIVDVDNPSRLAPIGAIGDIVVEGPIIAQNYLNDDERTKAAFLVDPPWLRRPGISSRLGSRVFKTNDLGRYCADGTMVYLGRKDGQVRVRGQRVEVGEVEANIKQCLPSVTYSAVDSVTRSGSFGDTSLVAFLCLGMQEGQDNEESSNFLLPITQAVRLTLSGLEASLHKRLPSYMVPSMYVPLRHFPELSSGKTDRKRLRQFIANLQPHQLFEYFVAAPSGDKSKPTKKMELVVRDAWSSILHLPSELIGVEDNFFRIGGNSISAIRLAAFLDDLDILVSVEDVFLHSTLRDMARAARVVEQCEKRLAREKVIEPFSLIRGRTDEHSILTELRDRFQIDSALVQDVYPCTSLQEGLMALSLKHPGTYVAQNIFEIPNHVDLEVLEGAWKTTIKTIDTLRTRIVLCGIDLQPLQVIISQAERFAVSHDLRKYLKLDLSTGFGYGKALSRHALIHDKGKHYFVWTSHHAVYDGWGMSLVLNTLSAAYYGIKIPSPTSFTGFLSHLADLDMDTMTNYWRNYLDGIKCDDFPPASSTQSPGSCEQRKVYKFSLAQKPDSEFTPSNLIWAAWAVVVSGYTASDDVVFGATLTGRNAPVSGISRIAGPTITTLPIRTKLNCEDTVAQFLKSTQKQAVAMMPFEHAGLQNIRRMSEYAERACQFRNLLVVQPADDTVDQHQSIGLRKIPADKQAYRTYPLMLECWLGSGNVTIEVHHDANVISGESVATLMFQFDHVLQQICEESPLQRVHELELISSYDKERITSLNQLWPPSTVATVHGELDRKTSAIPNAIAVCSWDGSLTFSELSTFSFCVAQYLSRAGFRRGDKIPFCVSKSRLAIAIILGILKLGGACVPLSAAQPKKRLADILCDVSARAVVVSSEHGEMFGAFPGLQVITMDWALLTTTLTSLETTLLEKSNPDDAAFIVYTSGSTGKAKGVVQHHSAVCTSVSAQIKAMSYDSRSRVLQFAAFTFDISISDIFSTLFAGGCVCVPSEQERMDNLASAIRRMSVTHMCLTPTVARTLRASDVSSVKVVALAGEMVTQNDLKAWTKTTRLIIIYGVTECTIFCTCTTIPVNGSSDGANIGQGNGAVLWIVDPENVNRLAPYGAIGELLVDGPIVSQGYLNNPEKTEAAFITCPIWARELPCSIDWPASRRLYRTGDLARYNEDGSISYIGRRDTQVKIRGHRVEISAIEHQIEATGLVKKVAVDVVRTMGEEQMEMLTAFLHFQQHGVGNTGSILSTLTAPEKSVYEQVVQELLLELPEQLPAHMVPTVFVPVNSVPLTLSGKVDRASLRHFAMTLPVDVLRGFATSLTGREAASTKMELRLRSLWARILKIGEESICADNSFLSLGGNSLDAMQLVALSRQEGLDISVADVFNHPLLRDMAIVSRGAGESDTGNIANFSLLDVERDGSLENIIHSTAAQCMVTVDEVEDAYPCTSMQAGLFALSLKQTGAYISQDIMKIPNDIDLVRLKSAWELVIDSVPVLRTRFASGLSRILQVVMKSRPLWTTFSCLEEYLEKDKATPMNLGDSLFRFAISKLSNGQAYFVWTAHHAMYDGWSVDLIFHAVQAAYDSTFQASENLYVADFRPFVQHQYKQEGSERMFWSSFLSGAPASQFPPLPSERYAPQATSYLAHSVKLPHRTSQITDSTIARSAWALLMSQYLGSTDVIFGIISNGRSAPLPDIALMPGPTITAVPFRIRFESNVKISDFLNNVQTSLTGLIKYEQTGLQNIQNFGPEASEACKFQTLFVTEVHSSSKASSSTSLDLHRVSNVVKTFETYALVIKCKFTDGKLCLEINYDDRILETKQLWRIVYQFEYIFEQLCSHKTQQPLTSIRYISPQDKLELEQWNNKQPYVIDRCVHDLISEQVLRHPHKPALCSWDGEMSYHQLDVVSSQVAHELMRLGVTHNIMVPICFEKSLWAIVAILAILKSGGAFVPLDPDYPPGRIDEIVRQTRAKIAITSTRCMKNLNDRVQKLFVLGEGSSSLLPEIKSRWLPLVESSQIAYVIFTSGSTGKPKGVVLEHRAVSTSSTAHGDIMKIRTDSRVFQFAAYTFDAAIAEILTALICGACVCIPSDAQRMGELVNTIEKFEATWAFFTPSVIRMISQEGMPSLKTVVFGGEAANKECMDLASRGIEAFQGYGPTECCVFCATTLVGSALADPRNIGHTIGSISWVVDPDDHHRLVPIGTVGELLIQGPILARGYLDNATKTREAFVQNPAWLPDTARYRTMYRTGDLVVYNSDGTLNYIGRKDTQVKLRGQRIDLGEIEAALYEYLSTDAVVEMVTLQDGSEKAHLVAFFPYGDLQGDDRDFYQPLNPEMDHDFRKIVANIREVLGTRLPGYMIPTFFLPLHHVPHTTSGKTDRKVLRNLASALSFKDFASVSDSLIELPSEPLTATEQLLADIWAEILKRDPKAIHPQHDFLQLGGNSIDIMQLVSRTSKRGISLNVAQVFQNTRLCDMAKVTCEISASTKAEVQAFSLMKDGILQSIIEECSCQSGIAADLIEDCFPCSPVQSGLMALSLREGTYVAQGVIPLPDNIDPSRFCAAWDEVALVTPMLRSRIVQTTNSGMVQIVTRQPLIWTKHNDLDQYLAEDRKNTMNCGDRLLRYALITEPETSKRHFIWTAHHALYDGWSSALIFEQVERAYMGLPLRVQADYRLYIEYLRNADEVECTGFWRKYLAKASAATFPLQANPDTLAHANNTMERLIPVRSELLEFTLPTIIRAAWAVVVATYTACPDVVFGTTLTGRNAPIEGIADMVGPTLTAVPVRLFIERNETLRDLLLKTHAESVNMIPFEHLGLQTIRNLDEHTRIACGFQNLLLIQPPNATREDDILGFGNFSASLGAFNSYALMMECKIEADGLRLVANFDSGIIDQPTMCQVMQQFQHTLEYLVSPTSLSRKIKELSFLTPTDNETLWAMNALVPAPVETCLHSMFQSQVSIRPSSNAICGWDGSLTYQTLDIASTKLAFYLLELGIASETMVPFCFEKSIWAVVSIIAILKAGGTCVPLDPSHPKTRIQHILSQLNSTLVLVGQHQVDIFDGTALDIVKVDEAFVGGLRQATGVLPSVPPNNAAFVAFTSGSSGTPKGVIQEHRAICTNIKEHAKVMQITETSRVLQFAAYTFDPALGDIFATLSAGGCLCVISEDQRRNDLARAINHFRANQACLTPTVVSHLKPEEVPYLKKLSLGGESPSREIVDRWADNVYLMNVWGVTECTTWSAINAGLSQDSDPRDLGYAVGGGLWITNVEDCDSLVPFGAIGELVVEGSTLARGYLPSQQVVEERFLEDPAWLLDGKHGRRGRIYRTGDLARFDSKGHVIYLGRQDAQVKLRGHRIELAEVDSCLRRCIPQGIEAVCAVAKFNDRATDSLIAFMSTHGNSDHENQISSIAASLERQLQKLLPGPMVPSAFVLVSQVPLTVSGKVDRRALKAQASAMSWKDSIPLVKDLSLREAPATEAEIRMASLWASILNLAPCEIGRDDSFLRLGGDSMSAIRLVVAARASGFSISAKDIFTHPHLSTLAMASRLVDVQESIEAFALLGETAGRDVVLDELAFKCRVSKDTIEDVFPCTPLQDGLLALSIKEPGAYIAQEIIELSPETIPDEFCTAWNKVSQIHKSLRTRIVQRENGNMQVILHSSEPWSHFPSIQACRSMITCTIGFGDPLSMNCMVQDEGTGRNYFVWRVHHAVYDGWSVRTWFEDLEKAYRGISLTMPVDFKYFVNYITKTDQQAMSDYFRTQLKGASATSFPQYPVNSSESCPTSLAKASIALAPRKGSDITLSTKIHAAWSLLLCRYAEAQDIVLGVTLSGRNVPLDGIEKVTGPTIATVPMLFRSEPSEKIQTWLGSIQRNLNEVIPFQHMGIQNIRRLSEDARLACDFRVLLVVQPLPAAQTNQASVFGEVISSTSESFHVYPLTIICNLTDGGIDVTLTFNSSVIDPKQVNRMFSQFNQILLQLSNETTDCVAEIDYMSAEDVTAIGEWNSELPSTSWSCVHQLFEKSTKEYAETTAVEAWDGRLSYLELDQLSTNLAWYLEHEYGIGRGSLVPVCFEKSLWMPVAMMAILKAGAACVPMDPAHPINRLNSMVTKTQASLVLASSINAPRLEGEDRRVFVVSKESALDLLPQVERSRSVATPSDNAFVVFTSGSTGTPKGIPTTHAAFCSSAMAYGPWLDLGEHTRFLQFSASAFDVHLAEIFTTLIFGGCVCIPSDHERMNDLAGAISRMQVNQACLTTSVAGVLKPEEVPTLTNLTLAGEKMRQDNIKTWAPNVILNNLYGPAEAAVFSTGSHALNESSDPRNIGRGINMRTWVVDQNDHDRLVPIGLTGELLLEGPNVAIGYLRDPEKSACSFITNPKWATQQNHKEQRVFYKTGDLVQYASDGSLLISGRKDSQIKLRGQRIELEEIETVMRDYLGPATDIAVIVLSSNRPSPILAGFICIPSTSEEDSSTYIAESYDENHFKAVVSRLDIHLTRSLPTYMVPSAFLPLARMPFTASGKVDRRALSEIAASLPNDLLEGDGQRSTSEASPTSIAEISLERMWAMILGQEPGTIGLNDDFLKVGGDSTDAMRLVAAARSEGFAFTVADVFRRFTLGQLAQLKRHGGENQEKTRTLKPSMSNMPSRQALMEQICSEASIRAEDVEDMAAMTEFQAASVAAGVMKSRGWTSYFVVNFNGSVDVHQLAKACQQLVDHHPILRTAFFGQGQRSMQVVLRKVFPHFTHIENCQDMENCCSEFIDADLGQPAGLGDLHARFGLLQDTDSNTCLIVRMSHAQYDGMCLPHIFKDLSRAYLGQPLSTRPTFLSFVHAVEEQVQINDSETYWRNFLKGSQMVRISSNQVPTHQFPLSNVLERNVSAVSLKAFGLTFATVLKASWSLVLSELCRTNDVLFGHLVSGRNLSLEHIDQIVGPCINFVPVRVKLEQTCTALDLLQNVQDQQLAAIPHESMSIKDVVQKCTDWPAWTRFTSTVQYQNLPETFESMAFDEDLTCTIDCRSQPPDMTDIAIIATPLANQEIKLELCYNETNVPTSMAEEALVLLCNNITALSTNLERSLPNSTSNSLRDLKTDRIISSPMHVSSSYQASVWSSPVPSLKQSSSYSSLDSLLPTSPASPNIAAVEDDIKRAISTIILPSSLSKASGEKSALASSVLDGERPYYDMRGDHFAAVQLADFLQRQGHVISVEHVIDNPTVGGLSRFLAARNDLSVGFSNT